MRPSCHQAWCEQALPSPIDGGAVAATPDGDVIRTVRLEVRDAPNPDGTLSHEYLFPDGRVEGGAWSNAVPLRRRR